MVKTKSKPKHEVLNTSIEYLKSPKSEVYDRYRRKRTSLRKSTTKEPIRENNSNECDEIVQSESDPRSEKRPDIKLKMASHKSKNDQNDKTHQKMSRSFRYDTQDGICVVVDDECHSGDLRKVTQIHQ